MADELLDARAGHRPAAAGRPRRRAALGRARLRLPARRRRARSAARRARAARQLRAARGGRRRRGALPRAVRAPRRRARRASRASRPDDAPGNLQAWARDVRYAAAAEMARAAALVAAGHTASDQAETVLYRLAASPGRRALLGMRAALGPSRAPAAHGHARGDRRVVPRPRPGVARRRDQRLRRVRARARPPRAAAGAGGRRPARARPTSCAPPSCCARRPRCSTSWSTRRWPAATASRCRTSPTLPPALARLVVRRLAEDATGGLCARAPARLDEILALGDDGALGRRRRGAGGGLEWGAALRDDAAAAVSVSVAALRGQLLIEGGWAASLAAASGRFANQSGMALESDATRTVRQIAPEGGRWPILPR